MFILNIPKPCHENWSEMTPEAQGRFCGSCQKIVVDFTGMNDDEVKNYLLDRHHQDTCGRFLATQLSRPLENQPVTINSYWYGQLPYAKQIFYAFAVFFVLGASSCNWETKGEPQPAQQSIQTDTITMISTMGEPAYRDSSCAPQVPTPPKSPVIFFNEPVITGDVAIETGVPEFPPEPDTARMIVGKIVAPPPPPDTVKPEPMIMGGISLPIAQDSSTH